MELKISKLESARRQLETAVVLYFHGSDPVSIHTLAAAAHQVLTDLSRRTEDGVQMLMDWICDQVTPESQAQFRRTVAAAENFFKHADRDHDAVLEAFDPEQSCFLLLDGCFAYRRLTFERPPIFVVFEAWSTVTWGKEFLSRNDIPRAILDVMGDMSRHEFFDTMLPVAHALAIGLKAPPTTNV